jgi:hypothetical protein
MIIFIAVLLTLASDPMVEGFVATCDVEVVDPCDDARW